MKKTSKLTAERARELLDYDPETGVLRWKKSRGGSALSGSVAGSTMRVSGKSYRYLSIDGHKFLSHRVIWLMCSGIYPEMEIDHIDGDGLNNRISNLRHVSHSENQKNSRKQSNNTSGVSGVHWNKTANMWQARIKVNGKTLSIGYYKDIIAASNARKAAEKKYGFHQNHGTERPL